MQTLFGPAGNCELFYAEGGKTTLDAAKWVKEKGLDAYEYSFGRGFIMPLSTAQAIGKEFSSQNVALSVHAPYYINFANPDEEMFAKSCGYIVTGIKFLRAFGAERLIFHPASTGKEERGVAFERAKQRIGELVNSLDEQGLLDGIYLCPETMGKQMQIGTVDEILQICLLNEHLIPTFDFGHINALTHGSLKTKEDFLKILRKSIEMIGYEKTNLCHIHFSKIQYGEKGEIRHLNFDDQLYGPNFEPLCEALIELNLHPRIICESAGNQAMDSLEMKKIYTQMLAESK